ncbi:MAG: hypothetical protein SNJ55_13560 [Chloroherpetonaceae bacterium]
MPHNNDLETSLQERLDALPNQTKRLLYDIDYDEQQVIEVAKKLLGKNAFPLSPRLDGNRLTIFAAFASAMADDEYAELDSFYNRLSEIFFGNLALNVNQQNEIRDFVEQTCGRFKLRFLRNQNRQVRNTIWLHGGLPSRHWKNFFERVLIPIDDSLENLNNLLNPPTPKTIKRFFDHCGDSARVFLRDCIEMRDALLENDKTVCAEDFGVSESFFNAFVQFLEDNPTNARTARPKLFLDLKHNVVINQTTGEIVQPERDVYAFNTNYKQLTRGEFQLPKRHVILVHRKKFTIPADVPRWIESEPMQGDWKDYRCEWLNLLDQTQLVLEHGTEKRTIDIIETPEVTLVGNPMMLNGRTVFAETNDGEVSVYTELPALVIENCSENSLSKLQLFVNGERKEINISPRIALSSLCLREGVHTIQVRGARGLDALRFAYLPDLKLRLDKNEYRASETVTLFVGQNQEVLLTEKNRTTISYNNFRLSIPIPRQAWCIGDGSFSSEPLSIPADKLPSLQATKFLEAMFCTTETSVKFCIRNHGQIVHTQVVRMNDASCRIDLAPFQDRANANMELDFLFQFKNGKTIHVLKTYKAWKPEIRPTVTDKTVSFEITDNAEGFKNRELVFWNLCRLWEMPIVVSVPDNANTITHKFQHEGEYGVQARTKRTGWGKPKEDSPFDVPNKFNAKFNIGNVKFTDQLRTREQVLLDVVLKQSDNRIKENEFAAILTYLHKQNEQDKAKKWIHLFLASPSAIRERFQAFLYSENHQSVKDLRGEYEKIVCSIVNKDAIVTQFQVPKLDITFRSTPYRENEYDGFKLIWRTNATEVEIKNIPVGNGFRPTGERFVKTEFLHFYTLIAKKDNMLALATVAIAREPLILCFQAVQLNNTDFKLIWRVIDAQEVEIHPFGEVEAQGERVIQPEHGATYTLVTLGNKGKDVPTKVVKTEFAKPYIERFEETVLDAETIKVSWKTYCADDLKIEPNIGAVEPSGEIQMSLQQLEAGIKLVATNKGGTVEKELRIETELPDWFRRGAVVMISLEGKTFYAKVSDMLFNASGQLAFRNQQIVNFTICYSRANKVYVKMDNASTIYELSLCRTQPPLSNLEDFINAL